MQVSKSGLLLLEVFEGFKSVPYLDTNKIPTIGIGSTYYCDGTKVHINDASITHDKALDTVACHINKDVIPFIEQFIKVAINQNQIDALVCLIYNIGAYAFRDSSVRVAINKGGTKEEITTAWMMWINVNHVPSAGLRTRRQKELDLYFKPI